LLRFIVTKSHTFTYNIHHASLNHHH